MEEAVLGFLIGVAGGIVVGVLLGQVRFLSEVLSPYIKAVNALPRIVLGALFIIILGLGMSSKVVLAAFLVFFVVFFNAYQGVREVDGNLINNARVLGASRLQLVRNVVIPSAMTWIIASLHVAFGFAVIGAVVGEVLGAQHGLGVLITDSAEQLQRRRHLRRHDHHRRDRAGRRVADQRARAAACWPGGRRWRPRPPRSERAPSALASRSSFSSCFLSPQQSGVAPCEKSVSEEARWPPWRPRAPPRSPWPRARRAAAARPRPPRRRRFHLERQPAHRHDDGRRHQQADLPALPARAEPRVLQEVRRQHGAVQRGGGRRRRGDGHGVRAGRHGRRLVRAHHQLPAPGQGRRGRGAAVRVAGRADHVRHRHAHHLADPVEGAVDRGHRPRVRHRPAHPVPGRPVRPEDGRLHHGSRPATAPP